MTRCDDYVLLFFSRISFASSFDMISIAHKFHHLFVACLTLVGKELFPMYFFRMLPDIFVLFVAKLAVVTFEQGRGFISVFFLMMFNKATFVYRQKVAKSADIRGFSGSRFVIHDIIISCQVIY